MTKVLVAECVLCPARLQWLAKDGPLKGLELHADYVHPGIAFPFQRYEEGLL